MDCSQGTTSREIKHSSYRLFITANRVIVTESILTNNFVSTLLKRTTIFGGNFYGFD